MWTPDGNRVAFASSEAPLSWKAADGTGEVQPLGERELEFPQAFTPDGKTVVFEQRGGTYDIGMLSLDGERASTILLDTEHQERNVALSPDGRSHSVGNNVYFGYRALIAVTLGHHIVDTRPQNSFPGPLNRHVERRVLFAPRVEVHEISMSELKKSS